ncbi:MAG: MBL fold metallo-hydrolase, partial [Oscillospiraceae bacterium]|nr:MBL fold metallo-hydrolase [Oscillospiraceae bacterium]
MKARIYRGTKEIGGTCVELTADNGTILWIDLGEPLDNTNPNIDYANNKVDTLLISHPHQDHFGLMGKVGPDVPIYIGELSLDLINATKTFRGISPLSSNFKTIKVWSEFSIANTFKVTPYLVDHSTPEAFAFLVEADGKRIFYSGDFRATGRKNIVYKKMIDKPPKNIDLLLMEGTMVERTNHLYPTELKVEDAIYDTIRNQTNASFVISSPQNIDRFISVFKACKKANKYLVIDVYAALVLELARKQSKNIPSMEWEGIKVYKDRGHMNLIEGSQYKEFLTRLHKQKMDNAIYQTPSDFVHFRHRLIKKLVDTCRNNEKIQIIYSQWEGYLNDEHKNDSSNYINELRKDEGISF